MKLVDLHCDTIAEIYDAKIKGEIISLRENNLNVSLNKLIQSDYLLQTFALFVPFGETPHPYDTCMKMIDCYYDELKSNEDIILPALSFEDIVNNQDKGKLSALLAIEDGGVTEGNLTYLREFYRLGVRLITLTWNYENGIGFPNIDFPLTMTSDYIPDFAKRNKDQGLTSYGFEMICEMEDLGMMIDVSHLSDAGFWDVYSHTKKPFIASHSNTSSVCNVSRNLTDDMIHALGDRGGITGLNFCGSFLTFDTSTDNPRSTVDAMVRHAKHIVNMGGIDVLSLGSDFDGIPQNLEIADAAYMHLLIQGLEKSGFTTGELEKICYKNALRVFRAVL